MYDADLLRANIRERMRSADKNLTALTRQAAISQGALSDFLNKKRASLKLETLDAIGGVFHCTTGELLGEDPAGGAGDIRMLSLDQLRAGDNPRTTFDNAEIEALANDIARRGILQNLVVIKYVADIDIFQIVAGGKRARAVTVLNQRGEWPADAPNIPCKILDLFDNADQGEILVTALVENLQRSDLPPLDEAGAYRRLVDEFGWETNTIADMLGLSVRHVQYRLKLLALGPTAREAMARGLFGATAGREIARLKDHDQASVVNNLERGNWDGSDAWIAARVIEMLAEARDADFNANQEEMFPDTTTPAPIDGDQAPERVRIHMEHRSDVWIEADPVDGKYDANYCSPAGTIKGPMLWPTVESALGAASSLLASAMREISLDKDTPAPDRDQARFIMDWANDRGAEYGAARVDMPGTPAPADPDAGEGESNEDIATYAIAAGVERRDPGEAPDFQSGADGAPREPALRTPPGSIIMPPKPGVTAAITVRRTAEGSHVGAWGYQTAFGGVSECAPLDEAPSRDGAIVNAANALLKEMDDLERAHSHTTRGAAQARHIRTWTRLLIRENTSDPSPANKGVTPQEYALAADLVLAGRGACIADRAPADFKHIIEIAFPGQKVADGFVDAFEALFPPRDADLAGENKEE